jgi:hypothetical protein
VNNVDGALHFECYLKHVSESLVPFVLWDPSRQLVIQDMLSEVKEFVD